MVKRIILSLLILLSIIGVAYGVIAYAQGYRINLKEKTLSPTGILSASSFPDKASIWVDNKLLSATNASLSLLPAWYNVRISKEGYQNWEKRLQVQGEVVTTVDALLIPSNPSLRAFTVTGVTHPSVSPSGSRVAYIVIDDATPSAALKSKTGVWIQDLRTGTLGSVVVPRQIFQPITRIDWPNSTLEWAPDEKTLLLTSVKAEKPATKTPEPIPPVVTQVLQLNTDTFSTSAVDVTGIYNELQDQWTLDRKEKEAVALSALATPIGSVLASTATNIRFAPDDTKIFYEATGSATLAQVITPPLIGSNTAKEERKLEKDKYYVYDIKEDKNFLITDKKTITDTQTIKWYTDSKHIVMIEKDTIYIVDYDATNKRAVYAGPFDPKHLYTWPAGGKLIIMTNLNRPQATPNLYLIDLS